jgi:DNA-binding transcriptional LysR family regulator
MLISSEIDLCMSSPRFADAEFDWRPLYEEELFVLVPSGHRLTNRTEIDLLEIGKEPIVTLKSKYGLRQYMDDYAREAGFAPQVAFETEEVATLIGLVGAGFGVTLAPKPSSDSQGLIVPVSVRSPRCRRVVGLSWRSGRFMPPRTIAFRNHIISSYKNEKSS